MEMLMLDQHQTRCMESTSQSLMGISKNQPTLRDMFAMQAMAALIQTPWGMEVEGDKVASTSYFFAEQMLKAREVK